MTHGEQETLISMFLEIKKEVGPDVFLRITNKLKMNTDYLQMLDEYFYREKQNLKKKEVKVKMTNLEYLEKMKKAEEKWLDEKVIKNLSSDNPEWDSEGVEYRKAKALEIIAEELCKLNDNKNNTKIEIKKMKQILITTCEDCPYFEYAYSTDLTPFVCEHIDMGRKGIKDCKKIQEWCPLMDIKKEELK